MKNMLPVALSLILLASCTKNSVEIDPRSSFEGTWSWWQKSGGISGLYEDTVTSTDRMTLQFDEENVYSWIKNDTLIYYGGYQSKMEMSLILNKRVKIVTLENYPARLIIKQQKDTLELVEDVTDGFTYRFIRK